jgi:superfamily II DNA or RNA helicase
LLIDKLKSDQRKKTLIIFDEIHGLGSYTLRKELSGKISLIKYRLGLSATPEREYDEEGSNFIIDEVGDIFYRFGLEDAIKQGILCEFNYKEIEYQLTDEEKKQIMSIIASYNNKKKNGEAYNQEDMYRDIANVRKLAVDKLVQFREFIKYNLEILDYCIVFVQTGEYGKMVQDILIKYISDYHVYYADTEKYHLDQFAKGETKVLITCRKLNEGIDIKKCKNIILFSSDRSKLVTIQRIGRCLRTTSDPNKVATVIDFIDDDSEADIDRSEWINELSKVRRN